MQTASTAGSKTMQNWKNMCKERKVRSRKMLKGDEIQMEEKEQYLIWSERLLSSVRRNGTHTIVLKQETFNFSLHQILCMHHISFRPGF